MRINSFNFHQSSTVYDVQASAKASVFQEGLKHREVELGHRATSWMADGGFSSGHVAAGLPSRPAYVILDFAGGRNHRWWSPFFCDFKEAEFSLEPPVLRHQKETGEKTQMHRAQNNTSVPPATEVHLLPTTKIILGVYREDRLGL